MADMVRYQNEREAQTAYRRAVKLHKAAMVKAQEAQETGADEGVVFDLEANVNDARRAVFKIIADARAQGFYRVNV